MYQNEEEHGKTSSPKLPRLITIREKLNESGCRLGELTTAILIKLNEITPYHHQERTQIKDELAKDIECVMDEYDDAILRINRHCESLRTALNHLNEIV